MPHRSKHLPSLIGLEPLRPSRAQSALRLAPFLTLLLCGFAAAFAACTLIDDGFQPQLVEQSPLQPAEAGPGPSLCATGVECCDSLPCGEGLTCLDGACQRVVAENVDAGACRGSECPLPENLAPPPPASTCDDGIVGPGEADADCGGVCGSTCDVGQRCSLDTDCDAGLVCPASSGRCAAASCSDGVRDGAELIADCGGGSCPGCPDGTLCGANADCLSGVCDDGRCAAPSCTDGVKNADESAVDCGGACPGCPTAGACNAASDCQSGVCASGGCGAGVLQCCQVPTCNDTVENDNESDVDCGGRCADCAPARACNGAGDCQSAVCAAGGCAAGNARCCQAPTCSDGARNGNEVDVDCGGGCDPCPLTALCTQDADCESDFCQASRCADPGTCTDGVRNGRESAIDCGGGRCPLCADNLPCNQASDCGNDNCFENVCISCGSGVLDGTETDIDCGGDDPFCRRCEPGERCLVNEDCASGACNGGAC